VTQTSELFWRAVVAFLALPTVVAFVVPWLLHPASARFHVGALPVVAVGTLLLVWCVRDFYVAGRGTLAPWTPPKRLVTVGLYRVSRNPMYVAVCIVVAGFAFGYHTVALWIYAAAVALTFHLRVIIYEEPWLARTFGAEWVAYRGRVPRWFGRSVSAAAAGHHEPEQPG
jgi:protein-S-isoprenylcysteine O-methyltransferase Ste14